MTTEVKEAREGKKRAIDTAAAEGGKKKKKKKKGKGIGGAPGYPSGAAEASTPERGPAPERAKKERPDGRGPEPVVKERRLTRNLRVPLTDAEKMRIAGETADELQAIEALEKERKDSAADYKSRIEEKRSVVKKLSKTLTNGYEFKPIECVEEKDFKAGKITITRTDTGEVLGRSDMTDADRQATMFDDEGGGG